LLRAIVAIAGRGLTSLPFPDFVSPTPASAAGGGKRVSRQKPTSESAGVLDFLQNQPDDLIPICRLAAFLSVLASTPTLWIPKTSGGHTRQYFPIHEGNIVKPTGSPVFDTFAVIRKDQPLLFHWPEVNLNAQQLADLELILGRMTYFGRAESWCRAEAHTKAPEEVDGITTHGPYQTHWRCVCIETAGAPKEEREYRDYTLERRLAALPMTETATIESLPAQTFRLLPQTKPKKPEAFKAILENEPPQISLLRCLLRESGQDIKDGLERPIGTRWVHYAVPRAIYNLPRPTIQPRPRKEETVDLVRYALNTVTVHRPVLPPLTDALLVADRFRSAVLALYTEIHRRSDAPHPRSLAGREPDGTVCRDHQHAFWWPTDEDNDGFIDHVTVHARGGFALGEVDALRRLTRLRQRGGRPDLLVTPTFVGRVTGLKFTPRCETNGKDNDQKTDLFISATPYFCPLHLSHGQTGGSRIRPLAPVIQQDLQHQGLIREPGEIEIRELVFDYDPEGLRAANAAVAAGERRQPIPPRQFFPVIEPPTDYPPLPGQPSSRLPAFPRVSLKSLDAGNPFGLAVGLFVNGGTRFIRALSFCRNRRGYQVKGYGRMLAIRFRETRPHRLFALGAQSHFGLGLFVPAPSDSLPFGAQSARPQ
jgi:CRISPR-associated protein Csb2